MAEDCCGNTDSAEWIYKAFSFLMELRELETREEMIPESNSLFLFLSPGLKGRTGLNDFQVFTAK